MPAPAIASSSSMASRMALSVPVRSCWRSAERMWPENSWGALVDGWREGQGEEGGRGRRREGTYRLYHSV